MTTKQTTMNNKYHYSSDKNQHNDDNDDNDNDDDDDDNDDDIPMAVNDNHNDGSGYERRPAKGDEQEEEDEDEEDDPCGTQVLQTQTQVLDGNEAHTKGTRKDGRKYVEKNSLCESILLKERDKRRAILKSKRHDASREEILADRRAANRLSAFQSRQRRKMVIEDLQKTVSELSLQNAKQAQEITSLKEQNAKLQAENLQLKQQQQQYQQQQPISSSSSTNANAIAAAAADAAASPILFPPCLGTGDCNNTTTNNTSTVPPPQHPPLPALPPSTMSMFSPQFWPNVAIPLSCMNSNATTNNNNNNNTVTWTSAPAGFSVASPSCPNVLSQTSNAALEQLFAFHAAAAAMNMKLNSSTSPAPQHPLSQVPAASGPTPSAPALPLDTPFRNANNNHHHHTMPDTAMTTPAPPPVQTPALPVCNMALSQPPIEQTQAPALSQPPTSLPPGLFSGVGAAPPSSGTPALPLAGPPSFLPPNAMQWLLASSAAAAAAAVAHAGQNNNHHHHNNTAAPLHGSALLPPAAGMAMSQPQQPVPAAPNGPMLTSSTPDSVRMFTELIMMAVAAAPPASTMFPVMQPLQAAGQGAPNLSSTPNSSTSPTLLLPIQQQTHRQPPPPKQDQAQPSQGQPCAVPMPVPPASPKQSLVPREETAPVAPQIVITAETPSPLLRPPATGVASAVAAPGPDHECSPQQQQQPPPPSQPMTLTTEQSNMILEELQKIIQQQQQQQPSSNQNNNYNNHAGFNGGSTINNTTSDSMSSLSTDNNNNNNNNTSDTNGGSVYSSHVYLL